MYIVYDNISDITIDVFGSGKTMGSALKEAGVNIDLYNYFKDEQNPKPMNLHVQKATQKIIDYVNTYSGDSVPYKIKDGIIDLRIRKSKQS